ncbi:hypothetical protein SVAN01_09290 [Stagonosporopsis vannaccii]|nr:hypothetical protein SVAN01_09290 [Stagonosporopsis vannaccii]
MLLVRAIVAFILLKRVVMYKPIRVPFYDDIPEPVMVDPPAEHLTEEGVYIPPSLRSYVRFDNDSDVSHIRQLYILYSKHHVRRWKLPSWGWVGVRTHYGHSAAEWEQFRRRVVGAYSVTSVDEPDKFRILWIEDQSKMEGADEAQAREAFQKWFLEHSDPPDGHYTIVPTIQEAWSGYETLVCLLADKETIGSVLSSSPDSLDQYASIKLLEREFDVEHMREWAPKLVDRYTGSFKVSPDFLSNLDSHLDEDSSYGQHGSPSTWYLKTERTADGVLRESMNSKLDDEDHSGDPMNLGESTDEGSDDIEGELGARRDEL